MTGNPGGMARGREAAVERLVADWAAIPAGKHEFAPGNFHGTPPKAHPFEAFEKNRPLVEGI